MVRPLFEDAAPAQGPSPDGPASGQPLFQPTPTTPLPGLFVPGSVSAPAQAAAPQALFTDGEKSQLDALRGAARRDTVLSAIPLDQLDALWRELIPFSEASIRDYGAEAVAANESLSRTLAREMENFSRLRLAEASDELLKWLANPPRFKWFGASLGELEAAVRSGQRGTQIVIDRLLPIKTSTTALCLRADLQCLALTAPLLAFPEAAFIPLIHRRLSLLKPVADSLRIFLAQLDAVLQNANEQLDMAERIVSVQLPQWRMTQAQGD